MRRFWTLPLLVFLAVAAPACSEDTTPLGSSDASGGDASALVSDASGGDASALVSDAASALDAGLADAVVAEDAAALEICGGVTCPAGERCNAWTRRCQSNAIPYPPPGEDNGGPCTTETECRSYGSASAPICVTENGGDYCVSACALPGGFGVSDTFERSDCPEGSVCFATSQFFDEQGLGTCVKECREDAECRTEDGYFCRRTYDGRLYENGYCAPAHCVSRGCFGYACHC
ncbi:MAG: hypothetical protein IT384_31495 [Deltaproteobacteria bacterium]|nr:hypothetical protein [Deltaproteobacteria bacterium]